MEFEPYTIVIGEKHIILPCITSQTPLLCKGVWFEGRLPNRKKSKSSRLKLSYNLKFGMKYPVVNARPYQVYS